MGYLCIRNCMFDQIRPPSISLISNNGLVQMWLEIVAFIWGHPAAGHHLDIYLELKIQHNDKSQSRCILMHTPTLSFIIMLDLKFWISISKCGPEPYFFKLLH